MADRPALRSVPDVGSLDRLDAAMAKAAEALALTKPRTCPTCLLREERILARETRDARLRDRRWRRLNRLLVLVVFAVLGYLAYVRFGHDPLASVQR